MNPLGEITQFLNTDKTLSHDKIDKVFELLYPEIKKIANAQLKKIVKNSEISPTILVNECYLKLKKTAKIDIQNRKHFYSLVARCMRFYLVDLIRKKYKIKNQFKSTQFSITQITDEQPFAVDLLELDNALSQLEEIDADLLEIVELRFFAGFSLDEIGQLLNRTKTSIYRQWLLAKSMLINLIEESNG